MPLQLRDLAVLSAPAPGPSGQPLTLSLALIDEDPAQPRIEFDPASLEALASTIAERGVCQPVSVRAHPEVPGRYMLNFGARRLRAARLAGRHEIPAFVADGGDGYEQVIENEQREALTPMELALFVQRRMGAGESAADIARRLGKSRGYVTLVSSLIDAPDWLLDLYRTGKCRGLMELYELRRLHDATPASVAQWVTGRESISRSDLAAFKAKLPGAAHQRAASPGGGDAGDRGPAASVAPQAARPVAAKPGTAQGAARFVLEAEHLGSVVTIDLSAAPEGDRLLYVRDPGGHRRAVPAVDVRLMRVVAAKPPSPVFNG
jgi:ParB family transcriptional regulator, chromosome partitioning protein